MTAAYLTEAALDYVGPLMDAFKYDLKAATPAGWDRLSKVKDPAPAYAAAVRAKEVHGCHLEVVSNIVPTLNDDDASLTVMATWVRDKLGPSTPWHVTRFLPEFELSYLAADPHQDAGKSRAAWARRPDSGSSTSATSPIIRAGIRCARVAGAR